MAETKIEEAGICWPLDATTAALLGAYLANERSQMKLSLDGLSQGSFRFEDWFGAIERGEIQLTRKTLEELVVAYLERGKKVNLPAVVRELQREPFGALAREQRSRIQLTGWVTDRRSSDELPETTIAEEAISPHDRLLVTGPVVFLFAVLILVGQMLSWNWTESRDASLQPARPGLEGSTDSAESSTALEGLPASDVGSSLDVVISLVADVSIPAIVVLGLGAVLTLRSTEKLLCGYANRRRGTRRRADVDAIEVMLETDGIPEPTVKDWKVSQILAYIHPSSREAVGKASIRVAFTERVELAIGIGVLAAVLGVFSAVSTEGLTLHDGGPVAVLGVLLGFWAMNRREANTASAIVTGEIGRGLGWCLSKTSEIRQLRSS